jgi:hypothetical protein
LQALQSDILHCFMKAQKYSRWGVDTEYFHLRGLRVTIKICCLLKSATKYGNNEHKNVPIKFYLQNRWLVGFGLWAIVC